MDKDKSLQKIIPPKSLEKLIKYDVLAKRGLYDLGIETSDDKLVKEFNKLAIKFSDQILFRKLKNEKLAKFGKIDAQIYFNKLDELADKIIAFCQKSLKDIRPNFPLRYPALFFLGFLLMSKKQYQEAIAAFSECLKQRDQIFIDLLLWSGESDLVKVKKKDDNPLINALLTFNNEKIIPTSKEFRKLSAKLWNKFGKRNWACVSTLAGDCSLNIEDRENALIYYQKLIDFLAEMYTKSRYRTRIWRKYYSYLQEMYDEIIDFLYEWKGLQAIDEFIHKNENKYAPSDGSWLSHFYPLDQDFDRFANFDDSKIDEYLQIKKYSKKELIGYAIGTMYYDYNGLLAEDIKAIIKSALEIIRSLKNIYPQDKEIDFIYHKMSREYKNEILRLKQSD